MLTVAVAVLSAGAAASALLGAWPRAARTSFGLALAAGCGLGLGAALSPASCGLDALSRFFLIPVFGVCFLCGLFGEGYAERAPGLRDSRSMRPLFLAMTAAMAVVVGARSAVPFLIAWELMALTSFFLVALEDHDAQGRRAALLYLVCTHTATLALFVLFAVLGRSAGSLDFAAMRAAAPLGARAAALVFALGLVGFGTKAGLAPLHVWLQEAHPAAPSHVSAVLSAVLLKMGIYGLLRLIWLVRVVPPSWAAWLVGLGALSGVGGVLFALAQHDLKRLLAYHSVENIGIIALGLGLGCLGLSSGRPGLAVLGFAGACLHSLNHSLFKSLLFLGAGAFAQELGTRDLEAGGGLLKRMPKTGALSLLAAAAISGVPPLNGFISEWLVYSAALGLGAAAGWGLSAAAAGSLALIGGLAVACFTKAYGALLLGEPRTPQAARAAEPPASMLAPMAILAACCAAIGLFPALVLPLAGRAAAAAAGVPLAAAGAAWTSAARAAELMGACGLAAAALVAGLWRLRKALVSGRCGLGPTWGCGFAAPLPRARYGASSFAQPLTRAFGWALAVETHQRAPAGYWPAEAAFSTHTPDRVLDGALVPGAALAQEGLASLKRRMRSRLQYYLLASSLFLIVLLLWKL